MVGPFDQALMNLAEAFGPQAINYMPKQEAYEWLKQRTGEDFGDDVLRWEKWGLEHGFLPASWGGMAPMLEEDDTISDE